MALFVFVFIVTIENIPKWRNTQCTKWQNYSFCNYRRN